jgi:hypothetical protein
MLISRLEAMLADQLAENGSASTHSSAALDG